MKWLIISLIIGVLLSIYLLFTFIAAIVLIRIVMFPKKVSREEALNYDISLGKFTMKEIEDELNIENYWVRSSKGYKLKASYLPPMNPKTFIDGKERVIVCVHGWTSNRFAMLPYAKIYSQLGFHVFLYDHRNHFESDAKPTTMGDMEADDLQDVIKSIRVRMGKNIIIGTQGESMGSATVMVHAGRYQNVDFVVEDCGYNDLRELLHYQCKNLQHLPTFPTLTFANLIFMLVSKSRFGKVRPVKMVEKCENIPMYFIHGDADTFVPTYMLYKNYDAKNGYKKITEYKGSKHAKSILEHYDDYKENIMGFLKDIKII